MVRVPPLLTVPGSARDLLAKLGGAASPGCAGRCCPGLLRLAPALHLRQGGPRRRGLLSPPAAQSTTPAG
eukprot:8126246-Lingulodinium_polyedra.AAC.1